MNPEFLLRENQLLKQKVKELIVYISQYQKDLLMRSHARFVGYLVERAVYTDGSEAQEPAMKISRKLYFSPHRRVDFPPEGGASTCYTDQYGNQHPEELKHTLVLAAQRTDQSSAYQAKTEVFSRPVLWIDQQSASDNVPLAIDPTQTATGQLFSYSFSFNAAPATANAVASLSTQAKTLSFGATTPAVNSFAFPVKYHSGGQQADQRDIYSIYTQNAAAGSKNVYPNFTFASAESLNNGQTFALRQSYMQRTPEPKATEITQRQSQQVDVSISNNSPNRIYGDAESQSQEATEEPVEGEEEQQSGFDAPSHEQADGADFVYQFNQPYEEYAEYEEEFAVEDEQEGFQDTGQPFEEREEQFAYHFGGQFMGAAPGYQAYPYPYSYAGYADSAPLEPGEGL